MTAEMSMSMFDLLLDKLEGGIVKSEPLNQEKIHTDVMVRLSHMDHVSIISKLIVVKLE